MDRRQFLEIAAIATVSPAAVRASISSPGDRTVNDVSGLNPVKVAAEARPRSTEEVRSAMRASSGSVCVGGGRYSMGGQIAAAGALHLDMRAMRGVISLDPKRRVIRVRAGTTWRDVQEAIDPHGLAVKIMQSYSNFTVGGSVSVNCHGRYVGKGPVVNSVRALQMVTADGTTLELTREREPELFGAAIGGYGGLGVVTEVELDLEQNLRMERAVADIPLDEYPAYFQKKVLADPRSILHNADLAPPTFAAPRAITWLATEHEPTNPLRLLPRGLDYTLEKNAIWAITELPGGSRLQASAAQFRLRERQVVWRNYEASLDAASLEPRTRAMSTYLLQEYFVPVREFMPFAQGLSRVLRTRNANVLNVSIRHSPRDSVSLLRWAAEEVYSFVIYHKQRTTRSAASETGQWTRELVDLAVSLGGRYYLPYRLDATRNQFKRAYPESRAYAALKARIDPQGRFTNLLLQKYLTAA